VLAHRLHAIFARLSTESAVHGDTEVVEKLRCRPMSTPEAGS
jgi:hypothetical protein